MRVTTEKALLTLATDTAVVQTLTGVSTDAYRAVTVKLAWTLSNLTVGAGEGPIHVGFAHSDYTVAEIKECIESQSSINQSDKIARERANRLIRTVGVFPAGADGDLNDGVPIKTRLNWAIGIGQSVNIFCWNEGTAANLTTGAVVNVAGDLWVADK